MTPALPPREASSLRRRRAQPSWAIHSADGVRIAGGTAPDWWETARPADPEPGAERPRLEPDTAPDPAIPPRADDEVPL